MTTTVHIANLSCEACVKLITMKFKKLAGVRDVAIDLVSGEATVTSDAALTLEELQAALVGTHYEVQPAGAEVAPAA